MVQVCGTLLLGSPSIKISSTIWTTQPRFVNGSFGFTDPRHCSPNDPTGSTCFLFNQNFDGFYESSPIVVRIVFKLNIIAAT